MVKRHLMMKSSPVKAIAELTIDKYRTNPGFFRMPLQCYITNNAMITTNAHLISAMHTYGQYNGATTAAHKLCKRTMVQAATQISVVPHQRVLL